MDASRGSSAMVTPRGRPEGSGGRTVRRRAFRRSKDRRLDNVPTRFASGGLTARRWSAWKRWATVSGSSCPVPDGQEAVGVRHWLDVAA